MSSPPRPRKSAFHQNDNDAAVRICKIPSLHMQHWAVSRTIEQLASLGPGTFPCCKHTSGLGGLKLWHSSDDPIAGPVHSAPTEFFDPGLLEPLKDKTARAERLV